MDRVIFYKQASKYPYIYGSEDGIFFKLTGLRASAGAVLFREKRKSALFVDGRYTAAARQSVNLEKFDLLDYSRTNIQDWVSKNISEDSQICIDETVFTLAEVAFWKEKFKGYQLEFLNLERELGVSYPKRPLQLIPMPNMKNELQLRLSHIFKAITDNKLDAYLVSDPCSVSWCLGIRDLGTNCSKAVLARMLVTRDKQVILFLDENYTISSIGQSKTEKNLKNELGKFKKIGMDFAETSYSLRSNNLVDVINPLILPKAIKTEAEIQNIQKSLEKDSAAIINFLYWFHNCDYPITEMQAASQMLHFRKLQQGFVGESFECIAAADENAAIVHYSPDDNHNKTIENILLLDSGGQYMYGTTDITRTVALLTPTEEQRIFYTLVLKGHVALARAKFPKGTSGGQLDRLARQFLKEKQADYAHGTGHGVGYLLNVHEGPVSLSPVCNEEVCAGMILTNEPGYYREGAFGIRLENMMRVMECEDNLLGFETISLVPFDLKFVEKSLLTEAEISWIKAYHEKILTRVEPLLEKNVAEWLKYAIEWK